MRLNLNKNGGLRRTTAEPIEAPDACASGSNLRCDCGSLLARLVEAGVELKCRRCKRAVVLPLENT